MNAKVAAIQAFVLMFIADPIIWLSYHHNFGKLVLEVHSKNEVQLRFINVTIGFLGSKDL